MENKKHCQKHKSIFNVICIKKKLEVILLDLQLCNSLLGMIWSSCEALQWSWTYLLKNTNGKACPSYLHQYWLCFLFSPCHLFLSINQRPPVIGYNIKQITQSRKTGVQTEKLRIFMIEVTFFPLQIMLIWFSSFSASASFIFYTFWIDYTFQYFELIYFDH